MISLPKILPTFIAAFYIIHSTPTISGVPVWISVPLNPTYAVKGSQVLLNWTFSYAASNPSWRKWFEATETGSQIGKTIMSKYKTEAVSINRAEYQGRLEFAGNGGFLLKNVSLDDEGYVKFSVDFEDGSNLQQQIALNVTIPPSIISGLANETIAIENRAITSECTFESRPIPNIKWYINGVLLSNGTRFQINSQIIGAHNNLTTVRSTLTIHNVVVNDTGRMMCTAEIPLGDLSSTSHFSVHYAPKTVSLTSNKANGIAVLGDTVRFTCNATSLPSASYVLRHNGVIIMNSTNQMFEIANVSLHNEGTYSCMAYNNIGSSVIASRNLTIYVRPFIVNPLPKTTIAIEGKTKTIECTFKAKPSPTVTWYLDGLAVVSGSARFQVHTNITENPRNLTLVQSAFTINNAMLNDTGVLTCVAEHSVGNSSSSTNIVVHYAPKTVAFTSNKANGIAVLGDTVRFTCNATSLPSASYVLRHNDVIIMNSTNQMFEIANVSLHNEGTYSCMAYNYIGSSVIASRNLTIYVPPVLHSHSNDVTTVKLNSSTSLSCTFLGEPAPVITWYKIEGSNYKEVNSTSRILVANSSFSIIESTVLFANVKRSDHGRYQCKAVNKVGETEKNVTLNVTYTPIATAAFNQNYTLIEDLSKNATWLCQIESNPGGGITWYLDGRMISSNSFQIVDRILSDTSSGMALQSELTMIGITRLKAGILVCNASNSVGYFITQTVVTVHFPPDNLTALPETHIKRNGSGKLEFQCTFDANPEAEITWRYNSTGANNKIFNMTEMVLSSNIYNTRKKSVLRIDMVEEELQGDYQCIAANQLGNTTQQTKLIVHYVPIFLTSLAPHLVKKINESTVLQCKVRSNPLAQIEWYKNGKKLHNGSNVLILDEVVSRNDYQSIVESNLHLNPLNKMDSGNYTCKFQNNVGSKQADGKLIVLYGPEITRSFASAENVTETTSPYVLRCTVEAYPKAIVQWYYNGQVINGNVTEEVIEATDAKSSVQSMLVFIHGIKRSNNGTYTCNASNIIGSVSKSITINVWYAPDMLSHLNGTRNLAKLSNVTLECKAEGYPEPMIKWYKSGNILQNVPVTTNALSGTKILAESYLTLKEVTKNDTAEYKCEAENIAGKKEQTVTLNVLFEPILPMIPPNITANQSQRVELNCYAEANPPITSYNWTKEGVQLAETSSTYVIPSAQEASSGVYTCHPIYQSRISGTVTYNLHIQVPAHITKTIECTKSDTKLICSCNAHGVPKPAIFWTKDNSPTVLETGTDFNLTIGRGKDGRYHCNAVNILAKAMDTYNVFLYDKPVGEWTVWSSCNTSCGAGYQQRTRQCIFKPCPEHLIEFLPCNGSCITTSNITTSNTRTSRDDEWSIVIYVLIPVLTVMAIVLIVWLANVRGCRREEKEFIVPLNNSLSQPPSIRSMPTRRGIFLPDNNFGVLNSGYRPDGTDTFPNLDSKNYDTVEVEMHFGNDIVESRMDETSVMEARNEGVDKEQAENSNDANGTGTLSFYNSAYTHL